MILLELVLVGILIDCALLRLRHVRYNIEMLILQRVGGYLRAVDPRPGLDMVVEIAVDILPEVTEVACH